MHELDVGAISLYAKVYRVVYGRYISVYSGLRVRAAVGYSVDVYLLSLGVPAGQRVEHTHAAALKLEFIDGEVGVCLESIEELGGTDAT